MLNQVILETLQRLHADALASGDPEPNAMTVATADPAGRVHARMVLLKAIDARGLVFYTHYAGNKGAELARNPRIALCLYWRRLDPPCQVRVEGRAERLPAAESDAYFRTRERLSQIGAWASLQSQTLPDRAAFDARIQRFETEFDGRDVPRPDEWGGFLVVPDMVEFWRLGEHRWNERERWELSGNAWTSRMLYP